MKNKFPLHELRLGLDVIALSDDPFILLAEKAEIIAKQSIRFCEDLKIFWHGGLDVWIYDFPMSKKSASRCLCNWLSSDWFKACFQFPRELVNR